MVQQVASLKTESAASALPLSFSASAFQIQSFSGQSFNTELLRQTQQADLYQQPVQPKQPVFSQLRESTANERNYLNKRHQQQDDNRLENQNQASQNSQQGIEQKVKYKEIQTKPEIVRDADVTQKNVAKKLKETSLNKQEYSSSNSSNGLLSETKTEIEVETETEIATSNITDTKKTPGSLENIEEQSSSSGQSTDLDLSSNNSSRSTNDDAQVSAPVPNTTQLNEFDYIDYVTQMAEFAGTAEDQKQTIVGEEKILELNTDTNIVGVVNELNQQQNAEVINSNGNENGDEVDHKALLIEQKTVAELQVLNIGRQDLQVIIDAQLANNDSHTAAAQSDLLKLEELANNILTQMHDLIPIDASMNNAESTLAIKQADQALVHSLLSENDASLSTQKLQGLKTNAAQSNIDDSEKISVLAQPVNAQLDEVLVTNSASNKTDSLGSTSSILEENTLALKAVKSNVEELLTTNADKNFASDKKSMLGSESASSASSDINDNIAASIKSPISITTDLNEEQTKLALDSVSQRMQAVLPELSSESKSDTFIAALQNGVKEFKQQLAQSSEPNTQLKALIEEALVAASVEVTEAKQPKIDAVLQQVNAVLNIANSINYSVNQHHSQLAGIPDSQLARELNHQHIEGTKFANNITNQQSVQAANDKAVNIFKQEGQQQLAEKVRWMVNARNPSAEIRLDPPDLGGINIKINLSGDTAQVNFNVQSMAAKDALDQAVPKLREMLQQQGIELGQSTVQQDSKGQHQHGNSNEFTEDNKTPSFSDDLSNDSLSENTNDGQSTQIIEQGINGGAIGGIDYYA